jgi:hypothetical protein
VLKVVQIAEDSIVQGQNLRIMKKHLNFSSIDVHWHPLECVCTRPLCARPWPQMLSTAIRGMPSICTAHKRNTAVSPAFRNWLATAATNGAVVLWDLNMTDMKKTGNTHQLHKWACVLMDMVPVCTQLP